jgi:hypothetical protein
MRLQWAGHVAEWGRMKYRISARIPYCKHPLGKPRRRWEDNTMDLKDM